MGTLEFQGTEDLGVKEVYIGSQRVWVRKEDILQGLEIANVYDAQLGRVVRGIVYPQIEDATNPFSSILGIMQLAELDLGFDGNVNLTAWKTYLSDLSFEDAVQGLVSRLETLVSNLRQGDLFILGLDLQKFQATLKTMMVPDKAAYNFFQVAGSNKGMVRQVFEPYQSREAAYVGNDFFFYYPSGLANVDEQAVRLSELREVIEKLTQADSREFFVKIFEDLLLSIRGNATGEASDFVWESRTLLSPSHFATGVFQKFCAILFAIRSNIEEDAKVFLGGGDYEREEFTLKEIRQELDRLAEQLTKIS